MTDTLEMPVKTSPLYTIGDPLPKSRSKVPEVTAPALLASCKHIIHLKGRLSSTEASLSMAELELKAITEQIRQQACRRRFTNSVNMNGLLRYTVQGPWAKVPTEAIDNAIRQQVPGAGAAYLRSFYAQYFVRSQSVTCDLAAVSPEQLADIQTRYPGFVRIDEQYKPNDVFLSKWTMDKVWQQMANSVGLRPQTKLVKIEGRNDE